MPLYIDGAIAEIEAVKGRGPAFPRPTRETPMDDIVKTQQGIAHDNPNGRTRLFNLPGGEL
jgi:hypothetical protein